jgi:hypothetical protein
MLGREPSAACDVEANTATATSEAANLMATAPSGRGDGGVNRRRYDAPQDAIICRREAPGNQPKEPIQATLDRGIKIDLRSETALH